MIARTTYLKYYVLLCMLYSAASCREQKSQLKSLPNIVLIAADDLGYGGIGCYGNKLIRTPNLDQLALEGIRFTDFHSNGAVCSPTRAAMMTGRYQQRTGVEGVITAKSHRDVGLNLQEITLAEELKKAGYRTGIFGKWHLGYAPDYNPLRQGFDEFVGFVSGNIDYHAHIDQEGYLDWWKGEKIVNESGYTTDLITDYGTKFIEENDPANTGKPFFLYLPHEAPHGPYQRRVDRILRKEGVAGTAPVNKDSINSIYREMVEVMDEGIGKIILSLKKIAQYQNTMVLFLSDNGANQYGSNGKLSGFKGGPYEGGSRVPMIFSFPSAIKGGKISDQTLVTMDILPTILDFIGKTPTQNPIDGISFKEHLLADIPIPNRATYFSFKNRSFIRLGKWKLITQEDQIELYDLSRDLSEHINLASDFPDTATLLKDKLEKWGISIRSGVHFISQ